MATTRPPAKGAAPAATEEPAAPKKKSRLILILIIAVVVALLAAVGGGAAWFFLRTPAPAPGAAAADAKHADAKPPVFVTLEPFTVNLQQEGGDHYLQAGIVIQVTDPKAVDAMKTYMPVIRNRILLLLSSKTPSDIASLEGKKKLVAELVAAARESMPGTTPERGVDGAFLSSFVIQ